MGSFADVKRTLLAMALLLTPVFGVTGCGSDEITQLETEITQLETEITQFEARVDALEEQAGSRVTNSKLDPNSTVSSSENDELRSLENEFDDQTDDAGQFQSRSKNAAPEASRASDAPSEADCNRRSEFHGSYDFARLLEELKFDDYHRDRYDELLDELELLEELELHDDLDLDDLDRLDRAYYKLLEDLEFFYDLVPLREIRDRLAKCDLSDGWDLWPNMGDDFYER